jgi:hypothetical protein
MVCLLNPDRFDWAKYFLNSKAWTMILKGRETEATISFSLPHSCNIEDRLQCSKDALVEEALEEGQMSPVGKFQPYPQLPPHLL